MCAEVNERKLFLMCHKDCLALEKNRFFTEDLAIAFFLCGFLLKLSIEY